MLDRIFKVAAERGRAAETAYHACAPSAGAAGAKSTLPANAGGSAADFVVISSLAEGADRLVAAAGLKAGFALEAVLPFSRAEYSRDFATPQSRTAYEELLKRAAAVLELDGRREESPRAYEAAGLIMLANADLLITIWDGKAASGVGGTAEIISRAVAQRIPVIWIEPTKPNALRLSWPGGDETPAAHAQPAAMFRPADDAELARLMDEILALPVQTEEQSGCCRRPTA